MTQKLAHTVSVLLHPVWMPTYGLLFFFGTPYGQAVTTPAQRPLLLASVVFFTILIPLGFLLVQIKRGKASGLMLPDRSERKWPYLVTFLSYISLEYLFAMLLVTPYIALEVAGFAVALALMCSINNRWKISAHMCGMGGMGGAFFALSWHFCANNLPLMLALVLLSGVLAWARLECRAHTMAQLAAGFLVGFAGGFLPLMLV